MIKCCVCNKLYRHSCVNITTEELHMLVDTSKGCDWTCGGCRLLGNDLKELKALILNLQKDIQDLKSNNSASTAKSQFIEIDEIINEIDQRNLRKGNMVIFGVPEKNQDLTAADVVESERNDVNKILKCIIPDNNIPVLNIKRMGVYNNSKCRPIKLFLEDEKLVKNYIMKSAALKKNRAFQKIYCSFDRTPRQIEYYKDVRKELVRRQESGESDIRIKYFKGIPKIVSLN